MRSFGIVLVVIVLAGCASPMAPAADVDALLSPILYDGVVAEHLPIRSFDGVTLDAWVFRPEGAGPVPVIINFSPYWGNLAPPAATGGDAFSLYLIDFFVPRGYAVALVSARGTGLSDGCFTIGGPIELQDEDVVATFLATQAWANGNVTATGKSYDGTMAQGLLTRGNPHVRTIVPVSPISELYKYTYFDAVPYTNERFNTYYVQAVSLQQSPDPRDETYQRTPTRLCPESVEVQASQYHSFATGDYSPYWQARNYSALLPERIDASVFYIHGLGDWNVKPDHMTPWLEDLRERGVVTKLWLGAWKHDYPTRDDFNATLLRWLDHHLKGIDTGILDEPMVHVQGRDGVWRIEPEWPPQRARLLQLHPSADGSLADAPGSGSSTYADRPGPLSTVAFESEPLAEATRIVGAPMLRAVLSATGPRATLSATLLVDGEVVGQGFRDLAHRSTLERSEPLTPGARVSVDVRFFEQDVLVPAGSTVRLVIGHLPAGDAPVPVRPLPTAAMVTLHHGEGTALFLPLVTLADSVPEPIQPKDVGCWAC